MLSTLALTHMGTERAALALGLACPQRLVCPGRVPSLWGPNPPKDAGTHPESKEASGRFGVPRAPQLEPVEGHLRSG